jgi:hypothetical protein
MRIKIGPYRNWFGPYQCADLLMYLGFSRDFCEWLGHKIPVEPFQWLDNLKHRKIKVKIHSYDTWSMDHTLAIIIHPMLVQLRKTKHGSPCVDDIDVPEVLRSTSAPPTAEKWDTDEHFHKRWDWVLDEMIWAFDQIANDTDMQAYKELSPEEYKEHCDRIIRGTTLFGKYYQALWD